MTPTVAASTPVTRTAVTRAARAAGSRRRCSESRHALRLAPAREVAVAGAHERRCDADARRGPTRRPPSRSCACRLQVSVVIHDVPRTVATLLLPCVRKRPPLSAPPELAPLRLLLVTAAARAVARPGAAGRRGAAEEDVGDAVPGLRLADLEDAALEGRGLRPCRRSSAVVSATWPLRVSTIAPVGTVPLGAEEHEAGCARDLHEDGALHGGDDDRGAERGDRRGRRQRRRGDRGRERRRDRRRRTGAGAVVKVWSPTGRRSRTTRGPGGTRRGGSDRGSRARGPSRSRRPVLL